VYGLTSAHHVGLGPKIQLFYPFIFSMNFNGSLQFPYPVPVEQKEKQELLKQVSEEAGDVLQKVISTKQYMSLVVVFFHWSSHTFKFCVLVIRERPKTKAILP
jgi:hypothetical protein